MKTKTLSELIKEICKEDWCLTCPISRHHNCDGLKLVCVDELKQKLQQLLAHLEGIGRFDSNNLLVTMNLVAYKLWKKKFEELLI
jgi:hypothetical protein